MTYDEYLSKNAEFCDVCKLLLLLKQFALRLQGFLGLEEPAGIAGMEAEPRNTLDEFCVVLHQLDLKLLSVIKLMRCPWPLNSLVVQLTFFILSTKRGIHKPVDAGGIEPAREFFSKYDEPVLKAIELIDSVVLTITEQDASEFLQLMDANKDTCGHDSQVESLA